MTGLAAPPVPSRSGLPSVPDSRLRVEVIRDVAALSALRTGWEALVHRHGLTWPNGHPARFEALRAAAGEAEPYVVVGRRGSEIRTIAAGRRATERLSSRFGYWRFRGPRVRRLEIVHGGLLGIDDAGAAAEMAHALADPLLAGEIDLLTVSHVPADHPLLAALEAETLRHGLVARESTEPHGALELLPGAFDATLRTHLSKKRRNQLRREQRVLETAFDGDVAFVELRRMEDVRQALAWAETISAATYKRRLGVAVTDSPLWRAMLESAAAEGWMRAWFLLARAQPIAFVLGAVIGDRFHLETMGYRPEHAAHSPGKNAIFRALERLCAAEVRWVDYGVGDAMYKRVLGSHWDQTVTRRIFGRTAAAGRARRVAGAAEATHVAAARLADRLGALDLLRTAWRRRLERSSNGDSAT